MDYFLKRFLKFLLLSPGPAERLLLKFFCLSPWACHCIATSDVFGKGIQIFVTVHSEFLKFENEHAVHKFFSRHLFELLQYFV